MRKQTGTAIIAAIGIVALAGCASNTQETSGKAYLADYPAGAPAPASASGATSTHTADVDADVRAIAAVEPDLRFPARIGLARIENGRLTAAASDEAAAWVDLAKKLGPEVGEFVPVSPLIADMVDPEGDTQYSRNRAADVVGHIRRGAARQHLDYVLVYEVTATSSHKANALSVADVTILGPLILPSNNVKVEAGANALLLDVRNGYPYGTASAFAEKGSLARNAYDATQAITPKATLAAVTNLTGEVETMVGNLRTALAKQTLAQRHGAASP
jgi:hypothetical protein